MDVGIDFVKINDDEAAKKYGVVHVPALVYFRKRVPLIYDGKKTFHFVNTLRTVAESVMVQAICSMRVACSIG